MAHSTVSSTITVIGCVHVQDSWYNMHWLCACTGLLVQHALTVCMYRTAGTTCTDCVHVQDCWYTIHWLWLQQTAALHSVLLVLTKCVQLYVKYHVNCQQYILLHSVISKQQTYPTLNTHYHNQQQLCTTFICTEGHWKSILTAYCLQSADSQHSHCCCCWPTKTLTAFHCTNSITFVSPLR